MVLSPSSLLHAAFAILLFGFAIFTAHRLEHGDWSDPKTGQRHCRTAPDALKAWTYTHRERRAEDRANLDRWIRENPEDVDRLYGASCEAALHLAARFGREDLVQLLVDRGARLEVRDKYDATALHVAARHGEREVAAILLAGEANPDAKSDYGRTPLHDATQGFGTPEGLEARIEVAKLLLSRGADVNAREASGFTPLRHALAPGGDPQRPELTAESRQMAELLLAAGAGVGPIDAQGTTPLHQAAWLGDTMLLRLMLARGVDVNAVDKFGTALGSAASAGQTAAAELLVANGADVDRRSPGSPVDWEGLPLAQALAPGPGESLELARRRTEVATILMAHGAAVDARDRTERTLLHRTAETGDSARADLLLAHGADVDAADSEGFTPLHRAVEQGHLEVVHLLLARGADPGVRSEDGTRTIDLAGGDPQMEALLGRDVAH